MKQVYQAAEVPPSSRTHLNASRAFGILQIRNDRRLASVHLGVFRRGQPPTLPNQQSELFDENILHGSHGLEVEAQAVQE